MPKAINELIEIRVAFEEFERNMGKATEKSVAKHGMAKTAKVHADIAHIRAKLHELHTLMD